MKTKQANLLFSLSGFLSLLFFASLLTALAYSTLHWLHLPAGNFIDWLIALASFWWLLLVVTLPWNIHFQAREVLNEAAHARTAGRLETQPAELGSRLAYAQRWVTRSLALALALHLVSAAVLYLLAHSGISVVGYFGAVAALLLTFLRPAVRGYEYLMTRLRSLQSDLRFPREDITKLNADWQQAAAKIAQLEKAANPKNPDSWAAQQQTAIERLNTQLETLNLTLAELKSANSIDHARLSREAEQAIAQISVDGQFLNHVREIIRFVKNA